MTDKPTAIDCLHALQGIHNGHIYRHKTTGKLHASYQSRKDGWLYFWLDGAMPFSPDDYDFVCVLSDRANTCFFERCWQEPGACLGPHRPIDEWLQRLCDFSLSDKGDKP